MVVQKARADGLHLSESTNLCGVKTMHSMEEQFNISACIRTLGILSGNAELMEVPHSDSLNNYLKNLSPQCMAELRRNTRNRAFKQQKCKCIMDVDNFLKICIYVVILEKCQSMDKES